MAFTLSRIDRKSRTYDLSATVLAEAAAIPPDLTGVDVALLPPRGAPTAATVWYSADYDDGSFTVLLAGPDADSTGALVVPASADIWMRIADSPEVDAEKLERLIVLGGGTPLLPATGIPVVSVNGKTGSVLSLDADDVGAMAPGDGAGGALSGTYPNPGLNASSVESVVTGSTAVKAVFATYVPLAANPDSLIVGTITRDGNGAATSAPVVWPDGSPGTYTATTVSTAFPGAVDAYTITYGSPVTKTYTQPAVTRNASGAVTVRPAIVVS